MKKVMKAISFLMVLIISVTCAVTVLAISIYTDGDFSYVDVDQYHVALYNYTGESNILTVPAYFSNKGVSQIYAYAFDSNDSIVSIDFSQNQNQLDMIGTKAFNECTSLSGTMTLPASLRTLGYASFQGCTGLDTLYVNLGIRDIPEQCFNRCSGLRYVYLPTELESIDRLAFANCTSLEYVNIPSTVTYINPYAFYNSDPILYVYSESYAEQFAIDNGYDYVLIDTPEPTDPPTEPETEEPTEAPTDAPTDTPTDAPTEPMTEEPSGQSGYLLGDVNGDDSVDALDSTLILRYCADIRIPFDHDQLMHGDVDGDDDINVIDATLILRYAANIPTPYPIGEHVDA